jgi:hypothetical protein
MGVLCSRLPDPSGEPLLKDPIEVLEDLRDSLNMKIRRCNYVVEKLIQQGKTQDAELAMETSRHVIDQKRTRSKYVEMHSKLVLLINHIETSADAAAVFNSYCVAEETLSSFLNRVNLDNVDQVIDSLAEHMGELDMIQNALAEPILPEIEEEIELPSVPVRDSVKILVAE